MRFCTRLQLARTRRILAEVQAGIEKAATPARRRRQTHKFTPEQIRIGREWHERYTANKQNQQTRS